MSWASEKAVMSALGSTVLNGIFERDAIVNRLHAVGYEFLTREDAESFADRLIRQFGDRSIPPRPKELIRFFHRVFWPDEDEVDDAADFYFDDWSEIDYSAIPAPVFCPRSPQFQNLDIPPLSTERQLAEWLGISDGQLTWLSGRFRDDGRAEFSRYHVCFERNENGKVRCLEAPRSSLKQIQRKLLDEILDKVPLHPAAHGFQRGRSVQTYVEPHVGQRVMWKTDLKNFFLTIYRPRVHALFRMIGFPEKVADRLTGLTTHRVPTHRLKSSRQSAPQDVVNELTMILPQSHLPQGAPTSPALANLVCYRLDSRLTGLAEQFDGVYTRYADDLTFSGGEAFKRDLNRFRVQALAIISDEGFLIRRRKSRVMSNSRRQQVAGLVINETANVPREEYKRLKAILHNCIVRGPQSQNRDEHADFAAHLLGRITYIEWLNPARGEKLRDLYSGIDFGQGSPQ